jgi:cytochrome c oxidase assembly protein subunit 15
MDGELVPSGYGQMAPWVANLFENEIAVQFNHRLLAVATLALAFGLWLWSRRLDLSARAHQACELALAMAVLQVGLGIATLLLVVPVRLAALHQAGALGLVTLALWAVYVLRPAPGTRP